MVVYGVVHVLVLQQDVGYDLRLLDAAEIGYLRVEVHFLAPQLPLSVKSHSALDFTHFGRHPPLAFLKHLDCRFMAKKNLYLLAEVEMNRILDIVVVLDEGLLRILRKSRRDFGLS